MTPSGPSIAAVETPTGIRLADPAEGVDLVVRTDRPVSPRAVSVERFAFPVETAVDVVCHELVLPILCELYVRTTEGELLEAATNREAVTMPDGEYLVQIESLGVKCYCRVDGPIESTVDDGHRIVRLPGGGVQIGLRSLHTRPQATVHTSERPRDLMRAVSCFGSALKTTSPERAWPSLRGCPPLVDVEPGPFSAPEGLERRDTPVHIEVPVEYGHVFSVASLAYYLNAQVRPGPKPALVADGTEHALTHPDGMSTGVQRTLERLFLFDCVTRTEGLFPVDLHERRVLERRVDVDFPALYDRSLPEQVDAALAVPWEDVADLVPTWKLTADVAPDPQHAPYLPFAAHDLAHVRPITTTPSEPASIATEIGNSVADFYRADGAGPPTNVQPFRPDEDLVPRRVSAPPVDSLEHAWLGDGVPVGASIPTADASLRQLDAVGNGPTRVQVIANAPEMTEERSVGELYGVRELVEMDVTIHEEQTVAETRALLEANHDLLHYIGHATSDGLACADGHLDVRTLDSFGGRAFVLNACQSYVQGRALVDAGATGGVVTLEEVANDPATMVGLQIARLLNSGFSLAAALAVIGRETITGRQYVIVGSGNARLTSTKSGAANRLDIERTGPDSFEVGYFAYPTSQWPVGSMVTPYLADNTTRHLGSGHLTTLTASTDELDELLTMSERVPVTVNGTLSWSESVSADLIE
ncbi:hypothetical protein [Halomarina oriensis]|uniref:CHAT domain-containing protein n=1 Tax=Halomarina oriensis TaxID=671145 RepID=A0A6B0GS89_9EURY|nr:hypothetical protein [Halomarina oriensis]MWG34548.1 hypothetical protein [Halomarina oriensis]